MVTPFVLQDFDVGWVATDAVGQVALFTTGGPGPVPDSALPSVENSNKNGVRPPLFVSFWHRSSPGQPSCYRSASPTPLILPAAARSGCQLGSASARHDRRLSAKSSLSTRRTLTSAKKIFKHRLIERQWLIARIEECKRNHREM